MVWNFVYLLLLIWISQQYNLIRSKKVNLVLLCLKLVLFFNVKGLLNSVCIKSCKLWFGLLVICYGIKFVCLLFCLIELIKIIILLGFMEVNLVRFCLRSFLFWCLVCGGLRRFSVLALILSSKFWSELLYL